MTTDFVFPEDAGTGAAEGDYADAANFAAQAYKGDRRNHQVKPCSLTPDWANDQLDVGAGMMFVSDDQANMDQSGETRDQGVEYAIIVASRANLSIGTYRHEEVWVNVDLSSDDNISIDIKEAEVDGGSPPSKPRLKIGFLDTVAQTINQTNAEEEHHHQGGPVRDKIRNGEAVTIPSNFQQIYTGNVEVNGTLDVQGTVRTIE
ncbi:MAG: hypothetical protein ABEK59_11715 [Halobacteria archaeon]